MRHQQIYDKLAGGAGIETIRDEVRILGRRTFHDARRSGAAGLRLDDVVPPMLTRWGPLLAPASDETAPEQQRMDARKLWIALAAALHEVGLRDEAITDAAIASFAPLNGHAWLSDAFERQTPAMIDLLRSDPPPLTRRPSRREAMTFARPGDVFAIRAGDRWMAAHVVAYFLQNVRPTIELYDRVFDHLPTAEEALGSPAWGVGDPAGTRQVTRIDVDGLRHVPDPAEQFVLIASGVDRGPDRSALHDNPSMYSRGLDLFQLQDFVAHIAGGADQGS